MPVRTMVALGAFVFMILNTAWIPLVMSAALASSPPGGTVLPTLLVPASSTTIFGFTGFRLLGIDVGWYGIAGFVALLSGPVLYSVFRAIYGGPRNPSREAGNEALTLAEAEAAEDAA